MNMRLVVMLAGLLASAPLLAAADGPRIAYVDMRAVLTESKAGKQHKADLEKYIKDKQASIKKEEEKLTALKQTIEKEALTLSETQKQEKQRSFQEKVQALQKMAQEADRELRQKDSEFTNKSVEEIRKLISEVAKEEKVALVLGRGEVLYADDGMDLTAKVTQKFDAAGAKKK